jgi:hypothetical protein
MEDRKALVYLAEGTPNASWDGLKSVERFAVDSLGERTRNSFYCKSLELTPKPSAVAVILL